MTDAVQFGVSKFVWSDEGGFINGYSRDSVTLHMTRPEILKESKGKRKKIKKIKQIEFEHSFQFQKALCRKNGRRPCPFMSLHSRTALKASVLSTSVSSLQLNHASECTPVLKGDVKNG